MPLVFIAAFSDEVAPGLSLIPLPDLDNGIYMLHISGLSDAFNMTKKLVLIRYKSSKEIILSLLLITNRNTMTFQKTLCRFLTLLILVLSACTPASKTVDYSDGKLVASWEDNLTEAIMVDMFSPPVASRIYTYSNIAAYEALRHTETTGKTLAGRLNGLEALPQPGANNEYDFHVAALAAFSEVAASLVYTKNIVRSYEKQKSDSLKQSGIREEVFIRSAEYGKLLASEILKWAAGDSFKQTRGMIRYTLLHDSGSWEPTPPDFLQGAEPHWNKIRTFVMDSSSAFRPDSLPVPFSTNPSSEFYKNAREVVDASRNLDSNQLSMTAFWDDNPGVSSVFGHMKHIKKKMTPGGHWMAITSHVISEKKLTMAGAAELFAVTSIAVSDAFIASWDAKYYFQTIRPITYIHRLVTTDWQPTLQTPAFPEFPSGHATISAAAATVLSAYAGSEFGYTDSTEFQYGLPVRSFSSFKEAATECARSRFYGGIHFMPSNVSGTELGTQVGVTVLNKLLTDPAL